MSSKQTYKRPASTVLERPPAKRGKPKGAQKFTEVDERRLLQAMKEILPNSPDTWEKVEARYNQRAAIERRKPRDAKYLKAVNSGLIKKKKQSADLDIEVSDNVNWAWELEKMIERKSSGEILCEEIVEGVEGEGAADDAAAERSITWPDLREAVEGEQEQGHEAGMEELGAGVTENAGEGQDTGLGISPAVALQRVASTSKEATSAAAAPKKSTEKPSKVNIRSAADRHRTPKQITQKHASESDKLMAKLSTALEPDNNQGKFGMLQLVQEIFQNQLRQEQDRYRRLEEKHEALLKEHRKLEVKVQMYETYGVPRPMYVPQTQSSQIQQSQHQQQQHHQGPHRQVNIYVPQGSGHVLVQETPPPPPPSQPPQNESSSAQV